VPTHHLFHAVELSLPHTLTVLCTYQCTAACKQCCFESSPRVKGRLSLDTIIARISEAKKSFPGLRLIVFSGGEAFLLKDDLYSAVAHASSLDLLTRIVTNGSWGKTPKSAEQAVAKLLAAGITEINISTGLDHQEWVPLESVANAALALTQAGVRTLISVEADTPASDCMGALRRHPGILGAMRTGHLQLQGNSWMPFTEEAEGRVKNFDPSGLEGGCNQIFGNIVVTPHDNLSACCGLTLEHIPEMRLGHNDGANMRDLYRKQADDFLKFWIHVDGPYTIVKRVLGDDAAPLLKGVSHVCQACAILHKTPRIREQLAQQYPIYVEEVMTRFALSLQLHQSSAMTLQTPISSDAESKEISHVTP
jgi:hypothetical protein